MFTLRPIATRPKVHVRAKKDDFIAPSDAPGEGNRRFPSMDQGPEKVNPIKKWIMDVFKIKEIDYEKFRKESKWSIKPQSRPRE
jgi:hypothetical protein